MTRSGRIDRCAARGALLLALAAVIGTGCGDDRGRAGAGAAQHVDAFTGVMAEDAALDGAAVPDTRPAGSEAGGTTSDGAENRDTGQGVDAGAVADAAPPAEDAGADAGDDLGPPPDAGDSVARGAYLVRNV